MTLLHASAVAMEGRAILITGPSASGKSALALELMAFGGVLVADDQVVAEQRDQEVWLSAPDLLAHKIEARGLGLLNTKTEPARAVVVVDMGTVERERLPPARTTDLAGATLPLLHKVESSSFAAMLLAYLRGGRFA